MAKYDPEIVMEFYANAWPTEEGVRDKHSWVRGQWIPFDEDANNQSYPASALDRRLQVDWARDARDGPRVLMSLRVDFGPMG